MGIGPAEAHFLAFARATGVDFSRTLTLGRQSRFGTAAELVAAVRPFGQVADPGALLTDIDRTEPNAAGEAVLRALGSTRLESLDVSDFEGATVLHDLNRPLPDELAGQWTLVVDGGVTEHVFNFPLALESSMRLVAPGGHLVSIVPANQYLGHGFYQLSPEVFFRALVPEHGFEVRVMLLHEQRVRSHWFAVEDPARAGRRLGGGTRGGADLFVLARRIGEPAIVRPPAQSDYQDAWRERRSPTTPAAEPARLRRRLARALAPHARTLHRIRETWLRPTAAGLTRVDLRALARELPP